MKYHIMPGNQPSVNADTLFVWEASPGSIPYSSDPEAQPKLSGLKQNGTFSVGGLTIGAKSYCLGLAVGPSFKNVVAAAFAVPGSLADAAVTLPLSCSLQLAAGTSTDTVLVNLSTPAGYRGKSWNSTLRLFAGSPELLPPTPDPVPVIQEVPVPGDSFTNEVVFDNVGLATGQIYTVGFYSDPKSWTTLAAMLTFVA